jgi:hypothetical protein
LTYTPEGADPIEWDFDFDNLISGEIILLEKVLHMRLGDIEAEFAAGSFTVYHAMTWVLLRRNQAYRDVKLEAFECRPKELDAIANLNEARAYFRIVAPQDRNPELVLALRERHGDALVEESTLDETPPLDALQGSPEADPKDT